MSYNDAIEILRERAKGLSQTQLAKKSHLSDSQISRIFKLESKASDDALVSLAKAVDYPSETILKIVHNLKEPSGDDPIVEEGIYILQQLEGEDREDALRYLRLRKQVVEERGKNNVRKNKTRPATSG